MTGPANASFNPAMAGIVSYGSYVPYRRLKRAAIGQVLGVAAGKGERSVASFDEDSVSMAVEATRDALRGAKAADTQALFFATTTPPYGEKLNAATLGAATLLPAEIRAADCTGSVRAGLSAMLQASDAVKAGAKQAVVAMADCRLAAPEGKAEQSNGDAAAAFVFGNDNVIAEIEATASMTREILDTWRAPGERFGHSWEERFTLTQSHGPILAQVIKTVLEKVKVAPTDLAKIVIDTPNPRAIDEVARALKLEPSKFADSFAPTVGQTGAAHIGLMLTRHPANGETGRSHPGGKRRRRRRCDGAKNHASGCEFQTDALGRPANRIEGRCLLRQLPEVARDSSHRAAAPSRSRSSRWTADAAQRALEVRFHWIAVQKMRDPAASATVGMREVPIPRHGAVFVRGPHGQNRHLRHRQIGLFAQSPNHQCCDRF